MLDAMPPLVYQSLASARPTAAARTRPSGRDPIMTIRLRLTLWYTALLGATLILFGVLVYSAVAANLRLQVQQDVEQQAALVAEALGKQIQLELLSLRDSSARIQLPNLDFFARSVGVQVVGMDGVIYKRSSNLSNMAVPGYDQVLAEIGQGRSHRYYTLINSSPLLIYSVPLVVANQIVGAVQVIRPVADVEVALSQVSRYLILGTALSLVLAAIIGAFLARRALAPIDTITETAARISRARDLGQRLSIPDQVSEVGRLAATFNEMLDRVQQLFNTQERLIADVSHELRSPLTTVQGNVQLLQRMADAPPDGAPRPGLSADTLHEILTEVESETTRMGKMVNDLLLLAQADSGALQLQLQVVEMDTLLLEVYRQTQRMAVHRRGAEAIEIRLGAEDQALVLGDRERLRQLLLNLTDNAIKYTPSRGIITLSLAHEDGWVKVSVSDTGIGISPENREQIFGRFYRTDKARSRELGGSGLGLSIVQSIAEVHGGRVTVESELHQGSTFTLWLPELPMDEAHAASARPGSVHEQRGKTDPEHTDSISVRWT